LDFVGLQYGRRPCDGNLPSSSPSDTQHEPAKHRNRALTRYTGDGRLEIDNSSAERAMRAVALGRNY
jgi:hypothetical protein